MPEELDATGSRSVAAVEDAPGLWLQARITLMLAEQDAARAQGSQDALRAVTLGQEHEGRELFRRAVLDLPDAMRIW
ncbi:hypothetical protein [Streptomyces sp. NPDC001480]|uniref:hypothetical protein n=1 Tax=Streptomyces sp. NPDC001480 TaxID=3364577 RepID=UPI0036C5AE86